MSAGQETNIMHRIMLALGKLPAVRMFRNNIGQAWIGKSHKFTTRQQIWVKPGDVIIEAGRVFHAGLCKGSGDLIGLKSIIITPEMVGKKIAVFTSGEIKTDTGRVSKEQAAFINMVVNMGGIAFVARSEQEALEFINKQP